jgi:tryptophan synthase beta subunit
MVYRALVLSELGFRAHGIAVATNATATAMVVVAGAGARPVVVVAVVVARPVVAGAEASPVVAGAGALLILVPPRRSHPLRSQVRLVRTTILPVRA